MSARSTSAGGIRATATRRATDAKRAGRNQGFGLEGRLAP
jgi:hypothetical protein